LQPLFAAAGFVIGRRDWICPGQPKQELYGGREPGDAGRPGGKVKVKAQVVRGLHVISVIAMALVITSTLGCGSSRDKYLGEWEASAAGRIGFEGQHPTLSISKEGDLFVISVTGLYDRDGKHACKLVNGRLKFPDPTYGEATLSSDGGTIYWHTFDFHKKQ
jgi:hypothetical protein